MSKVYLNNRNRRMVIELIALTSTLELIILSWEGTNTFGKDKVLIKLLKTARTYCQKVIEHLNNELDDNDQCNIRRALQLNKIELIPNDQYYKIMKEARENRYCLDEEAAKDLTEGVIQAFCNFDCKRTDFENCRIRNIFQLWKIEPINEVTETECQYKY